MAVFESSRNGGPPIRLVCHHAGHLLNLEGQSQVDELLTRIINEHRRQNESEGDEARIRHQRRGGNEQTSQAHNCLTWLRYILKDFNLNLPRGVMDRLYADPKSVLPAPSTCFFAPPPELSEIDCSDWLIEQAANTEIQPRRKN